jgi:hypothetical protein
MNVAQRSEADRLFARSCHDARHREDHWPHAEPRRQENIFDPGRRERSELAAADAAQRDPAGGYCRRRDVHEGDARGGDGPDDLRDNSGSHSCRPARKSLALGVESVFVRLPRCRTDSRTDDAPGGASTR